MTTRVYVERFPDRDRAPFGAATATTVVDEERRVFGATYATADGAWCGCSLGVVEAPYEPMPPNVTRP